MATTVAALKADVTLDTKGLKRGAELTRSEFSKLQRTFRTLQSAEEKQARTMEVLEKAHKDGTISTKQFQEAQARLERQVTKTNADLQKQSRASKRAGGGLGAGTTAMAGRLAGPLAGALSVAAIGRVTTSQINYADALLRTANRLDINITSLQRLEHAARVNRIEVDVLHDAMSDLAIRVGEAVVDGGEAAEVFERINFDFKAMAALKPDEQLLAFADAIAGLNDHTAERTAVDMLLGDNGVRLINVLREGAEGIRAYGDEVESFGTVTEEQAQAVRRMLGDWERFKARTYGTTLGVAAGIYEDPTGEGDLDTTGVRRAFWSNIVQEFNRRGPFGILAGMEAPEVGPQGWVETTPAFRTQEESLKAAGKTADAVEKYLPSLESMADELRKQTNQQSQLIIQELSL